MLAVIHLVANEFMRIEKPPWRQQTTNPPRKPQARGFPVVFSAKVRRILHKGQTNPPTHSLSVVLLLLYY